MVDKINTKIAKFNENLHLSLAIAFGTQIKEDTKEQINIRQPKINESNNTKPAAFALFIYYKIFYSAFYYRMAHWIAVQGKQEFLLK